MRKRTKDNRFKDIDGKAAFALPLTLIRHENWTRLTPYANKLIMDLGAQYTGFNNGYLCASWTLMQERGWRSSLTLYKAELECEYYGLIYRTQHGGLHKPNLYAFTWRRIDEKPDRPLEIAPTSRPSDAWKEPRVTFVFEESTRGGSRRRRQTGHDETRFKRAFEKRVA